MRYSDESTQQLTAIPTPRRNLNRIPPLEPVTRDNNLYRRGGSGSGNINDSASPLLINQNQLRQPRPNDVSTATSLPQYHRPTDREYPIPTRKKSGPSENTDAEYYVGYSPEHELPLPYVEYATTVSLFFLGPVAFAPLTRLFSAYALVSCCLSFVLCVLCLDLMPLHLRFAYAMLKTFQYYFKLIICFIFVIIDDRHHSNKASTISLELGSNKHLAAPNSQYINSGQFSSSTIRSDRFPLYRRN